MKCWACGDTNQNNFYKTSIKDGRCKTCRRLDNKNRRDNNSVVIKKRKEYELKYKHHRVIFERRMWERYKLKLQDFDKLVLKQEGRCAICEGIFEPKWIGVDHCHHTGVVRGLLCRQCNAAIGMLNDDVFLIKKALYYLGEKNEDKPVYIW